MRNGRRFVGGAAWLAVLLVGVLSGVVFRRFIRVLPGPAPVNTSTVIQQIEGLAQLVTVKYVLEKVVILEDVKIYGENRVVLVAHGVVKAGIDLAQIQPEHIEIRGRNVAIAMPPAAITDAYLDERRTLVLEHSTGLLRRFDKNLQQAARLEGIDQIRRAASYNGILEEAAERARLQLSHLFRQMGYEEIEFR